MARSRTFRIRLYCTACTLERFQILSMLMLPPSGTRSVHPGGFHETPPSLRFAHQVIRVDNLPQGPQFVSQANALVGAAFIDDKKDGLIQAERRALAAENAGDMVIVVVSWSRVVRHAHRRVSATGCYGPIPCLRSHHGDNGRPRTEGGRGCGWHLRASSSARLLSIADEEMVG